MHTLAYGSFVLVYLPYASFSLVAKEPVTRLDPVLFVCLQMLLLVPAAFWLLARWSSMLSQTVLIHGTLMEQRPLL